MANPEHVEIAKAHPPDVLREYLHDHAGGLDLEGATLRNFRLSDSRDGAGINLKDAILEDCKISNCNLVHSTFSGAKLQGNILNSNFHNCSFANTTFLKNTSIRKCEFYDCNLENAILQETDLLRSDFTNCYCSGIDLKNTNMQYSSFNASSMMNADLDGIILFNVSLEHWDLSGVKCSHFFISNQSYGPEVKEFLAELTRVPENGFLAPGEFEDRFKSRPTIEYVFKDGMPALGPAALGLAVDDANLKKTDAHLRLLDITARGGLPRAIVEISDKITTAEALKLLDECYQSKFDAMNKEIADLQSEKSTLLLSAISQGPLLPAMGAGPKKRRLSRSAKIAQLAVALRDNPQANDTDLSRLTGIHRSDVSKIMKAEQLREQLGKGKDSKPEGWSSTEAIDESALCSICRTPINPEEPFDCKICDEPISGECKACHFTNGNKRHQDAATSMKDV